MKKLTFFIIITTFSYLSYCQEWLKVFGPPNTGKGYVVIESYDKGYIIGGHLRHNNYQWYYGWLLKTDINGELLWDIKFGNETGSYATAVFGLEQTNDGGLIISGSNYIFDNRDGFIMKLNACGEKEWCNIYKSPGHNDHSLKVHKLPEGGYIMNFAYWGYDLANKRIWLFKLDEEGNTVWQNLYGIDTSYINEHAYDMILTPDSGYLLTCFNQIEIDTLPGYFYRHPFFIKVNKNGEEEWEQTYWPETGFGRGEARASIYDINGNIYSTGFRGNIDEPVMIKISKTGQPLFHTILMDSVFYGETSTIDFLQDSNLVLGGYHGHANGQGTTKIWKVDTLGNILDERDSLLINVAAPYDATVTFDNKIVFVVTTPYTNPATWDILMYKLNSDLEWDSIYTQPFVYDYLCPDTIVSDTIPMDCDIITDLEEQINKPEPKLVIKPNPATNKVSVVLPEYYITKSERNGITSTKIRYLSQMQTQLEVYDIMGRFVEKADIPKGDMEVKLDVSGWEKGLYFIIVVANNTNITSAKLVVD